MTELKGRPDTPLEVEEAPMDEAEGLVIVSRSFGRQTWDRFRRHKLAILAGVVLLIMTISFWAAPALSPYGFEEITPDFNQGPSLEHPFGTDDIGRDLLVRTFKAGQFSLLIALLVAVLTTVLGAVVGAVSGYFGGAIDSFLSQVINLFLVVPSFIVLLVVAVKWGSNPTGIAVLLALLLWTSIARVVRGVVLQYKEQEFVLAARAAGAGSLRILWRHIIPNTFGPIIVNATLLVGVAIILESTLSFLALGVRPPTPTLGNLVDAAKGDIDSDPIRVLIPGGFVVLIALCINFLGDGLRDALDPTTRRVRE
ncbi:MAG TPA: ABC transporter permease [Acidimicrobiia bacterium]|nr:ABC transporter permease [Acidimicrobiia bacterium]